MPAPWRAALSSSTPSTCRTAAGEAAVTGSVRRPSRRRGPALPRRARAPTSASTSSVSSATPAARRAAAVSRASAQQVLDRPFQPVGGVDRRPSAARRSRPGRRARSPVPAAARSAGCAAGGRRRRRRPARGRPARPAGRRCCPARRRRRRSRGSRCARVRDAEVAVAEPLGGARTAPPAGPPAGGPGRRATSQVAPSATRAQAEHQRPRRRRSVAGHPSSRWPRGRRRSPRRPSVDRNGDDELAGHVVGRSRRWPPTRPGARSRRRAGPVPGRAAPRRCRRGRARCPPARAQRVGRLVAAARSAATEIAATSATRSSSAALVAEEELRHAVRQRHAEQRWWPGRRPARRGRRSFCAPSECRCRRDGSAGRRLQPVAVPAQR